MEKLSSRQRRTQDFETLARIQIYVKMRNIKVPINIKIKNNGVELGFVFSNMTLLFKVTNKESSYKECTVFIEEMHDEYNTEPLGEYTLYAPL